LLAADAAPRTRWRICLLLPAADDCRPKIGELMTAAGVEEADASTGGSNALSDK